MGIQYEIEAPFSRPFRRAAIQRRVAATGLYDGVWEDITEYVKRWGTMEAAIDDVRLNNFTHNGVTLVVNNDQGKFNHHSNASSLWLNYMPRFRSLLRIQAGYYDTASTSEFPTDPTLGIYIMDSEISIRSDSNDVTLRCSSLKSVFDDVRARDIVGITGVAATQTASDIITKIRDHSDGAAANVFSQFITSTSWVISTTTNFYNLTTTVLEDTSTWELMEKLAEAEGYVIMINRTGGIEFRQRAARQASSQFHFTGQGTDRPNTIAITEDKEAHDKYYNYFRLKYLEPDTSTSFVSAGTTTTVNQSNTSWINGAKVYEFENRYPANTTTAQAIVDALFTTSAGVPIEITLENVFIPHLEVLDRTEVSFRSYDLAVKSLWDVAIWDTSVWPPEGFNFDYNSTAAYIISKKIDLDNFKTIHKVRRI